MGAVITLSSCERIDAGCEGIKVNLYGNDRGVDDVSLVSGMVYYNIFTEMVYEYPTFVQTVDYPKFTINAKDGSEFEVTDIIMGPLFNHVRDAFRIQLNKFTTDEIVSMRDSLEKAVEKQLILVLNKEGFQLEQLTSGLKYPESIVEAVNAKNRSVQEAQKAENEVLVAEAEAKKKIVKARAEKEANELLQQSLTPQLLRKMAIDKWNGELPKYSGNGMSFIMND